MGKFGILKTQLTFILLTWISKNKDRLPWYVFGVIALAAVLVITGLALTALSPYAGEIYRNGFIVVGMTIHAVLIVGGLSCLIAFFLWNFGKGVTITTPESIALLSSKNWEEPNIAPDILVCSRTGETKEEYAERLDAIKKQSSDSRLVVAIPFRIPVGFVYARNSGKEFAREMPPFQTSAWTEEQMIVPLNTYFVNETEQEYQNYLENFAFYWREYSARIKLLKQDNTIEKNNAFKTIILNTLLFLFFAVPSFAQSGQAVADAVGTRIREIPGQGDDVSFIFEKKTFNRIGNGKSNYVELLKNVPMFRDCCHGALIAVTNGERIIAKGAAAGDFATDPMRPHQGSAIPPDQVRGFTIPDSNSMADMAEDAKRQIYLLKETAGKAVRPWWDVVIFGLWCLSTVIAVFVCGSFMVAYVTAKEGDYWGHKKARKALMYTLLGLALVLIIQSALYMNAWGFPQFAIIVGAGVETAALCWLVTAFVPNFWPSPGNAPARGGAHGYYANDNPRLGA